MVFDPFTTQAKQTFTQAMTIKLVLRHLSTEKDVARVYSKMVLFDLNVS
jgi:hypothetical protein